jgi:hypothetical protein
VSGARHFTRVQLGRRRMEPLDPHIPALYEQLLTTLGQTGVGNGQGELLRPASAWPGNSTSQYFSIVQWTGRREEFDLVVTNLAPHRSQCRVPIGATALANRTWLMRDLLGGEEYQRDGNELGNPGLYLDLPAHGAQLFHFQPVP